MNKICLNSTETNTCEALSLSAPSFWHILRKKEEQPHHKQSCSKIGEAKQQCMALTFTNMRTVSIHWITSWSIRSYWYQWIRGAQGKSIGKGVMYRTYTHTHTHSIWKRYSNASCHVLIRTRKQRKRFLTAYFQNMIKCVCILMSVVLGNPMVWTQHSLVSFSQPNEILVHQQYSVRTVCHR